MVVLWMYVFFPTHSIMRFKMSSIDIEWKPVFRNNVTPLFNSQRKCCIYIDFLGLYRIGRGDWVKLYVYLSLSLDTFSRKVEPNGTLTKLYTCLWLTINETQIDHILVSNSVTEKCPNQINLHQNNRKKRKAKNWHTKKQVVKRDKMKTIEYFQRNAFRLRFQWNIN